MIGIVKLVVFIYFLINAFSVGAKFYLAFRTEDCKKHKLVVVLAWLYKSYKDMIKAIISLLIYILL